MPFETVVREQVEKAREFHALHGDKPLDRVKETVRREIERGAALTPGDSAAAHVMRDRLIARMAALQKTYEFFVLPTVQVAPFDIERPYVTSINGLALPVGLRIVGRAGADWNVLQLGRAFEQVTMI